MPEIAEKLYYRIGEVEEIAGVPAYVLRYWESEFKLLRPKKNPPASVSTGSVTSSWCSGSRRSSTTSV